MLHSPFGAPAGARIGHIARGHSLAAIVSLVLLAAYLASPSPLLSIALLIMLAPVALSLTRPGREFEADDEALAVVGPAELAATLRWAIDRHKPGKRNAMLTQRLDRLDKLAREQASAV